MSIVINVDVMLAKRKMNLSTLAQKIGISLTNLSLLKTGKVKGFRFGTRNAICKALDCQPGDLLKVPSRHRLVPAMGRKWTLGKRAPSELDALF